jgi:hypothetical protein
MADEHDRSLPDPMQGAPAEQVVPEAEYAEPGWSAVEPDEVATVRVFVQVTIMAVLLVLVSLGLWRLLHWQTSAELQAKEASDAANEALQIRKRAAQKLRATGPHPDTGKDRRPIGQAIDALIEEPRLRGPLSLPPQKEEAAGDAEGGEEAGAKGGGADPGEKSGADPGTKSGAEPGTKNGADPGEKGGADTDEKDGADPGAEKGPEQPRGAARPRPGMTAARPRPGMTAARPRPGMTAARPRPGMTAARPAVMISGQPRAMSAARPGDMSGVPARSMPTARPRAAPRRRPGP